MCIAGAIVQDKVFSKVDQYFTVVEHFTCLDTVSGLCRTLRKDAVVISGGGLKSLEIFEREALARGWGAELCILEGTLRLNMGSQKLLVLAETDAPEPEPLTLYVAEEALASPVPEACTRPETPKIFRAARQMFPTPGKGEGKGGQDELHVAATIAVPPEIAEVGIIIVTSGTS